MHFQDVGAYTRVRFPISRTSGVPRDRGFVISVVLGLKLEGGVLDVEMLGHTVPHGIEDLRGMTVLEALIVKNDMGRQCGKTGGDSRGVEVVDLPHVVDRKDVRSDPVEVEASRGELHEDVGSFSHQKESPGNDHERYSDSGDGVGTLKPGGHDEHG